MKKLLLSSIILFLLLSSCKKEYKCVCKDLIGGTSTMIYTEKNTKRKAEKKCEAQAIPGNETACNIEE